MGISHMNDGKSAAVREWWAEGDQDEAELMRNAKGACSLLCIRVSRNSRNPEAFANNVHVLGCNNAGMCRSKADAINMVVSRPQ